MQPTHQHEAQPNMAKEFANASLASGYTLKTIINSQIVDLKDTSGLRSDDVVIAFRRGALDASGHQTVVVSLCVNGKTQVSDQRDKFTTLTSNNGDKILLTKAGNIIINEKSIDPTVSSRTLQQGLLRPAA